MVGKSRRSLRSQKGREENSKKWKEEGEKKGCKERR